MDTENKPKPKIIVKAHTLSIIRVAHVDIGSVFKTRLLFMNITGMQEDPLAKPQKQYKRELTKEPSHTTATDEESKTLKLYCSVQRKDYP